MSEPEKRGLLGRIFGGKPKPEPEAEAETGSDAPSKLDTEADLQPGPVAETQPSTPPVMPMPGQVTPPVAHPRLDDEATAQPQTPVIVDAPTEAERVEPDEPEEKPARRGWFTRLKDGLARSSSALSTGITDVFTKRRLDAAMLDELEDLLIQADLGVATAAAIAEKLRADRFEKDISPEEVRKFLAGEIAARLDPVAKPLALTPSKPHVVLVVGVNGSGKTTTIGKLAAQFAAQGRSVMMAAGDTFRAAAIDQLRIWGERVGAPVVTRDVGADAAGLAFDALEQAREAGADVLLIDTAGRLQNKAGLMDELAKIVRVLKKQVPDAPHSVLLVLDATTGQNAVSQAEVFTDIAGVTGLIMTKLDGTARGGILVAIAEKFGLPVHAIGVGEGVDDLNAFKADEFAGAIVGLTE